MTNGLADSTKSKTIRPAIMEHGTEILNLLGQYLWTKRTTGKWKSSSRVELKDWAWLFDEMNGILYRKMIDNLWKRYILESSLRRNRKHKFKAYEVIQHKPRQ